MKQAERIADEFPIMRGLTAYLSTHGKLRDVAIGWHCHLTELTALSVEVLLETGARVMLSECNPVTTDLAAVKYMRQLGSEVFLGPDSCAQVLDRNPMLLSDTGLVLISECLQKKVASVKAACEITTSGITRLRQIKSIPFPVVNINDGHLKGLIENFHGVGDGLVDSVTRLTGRMWAGRKAAVVGYGLVGAGVAAHLSKLGVCVMVVEKDPLRCLTAHYDGFVLTDLNSALAQAELLVTATGQEHILGAEQWCIARDGLYVFNVGHWASEVDREGLKKLAVSCKQVREHLECFELPGIGNASGRRIYLATKGSPVNVVLLAGSDEPTLIHLTTEVLCLNFLIGSCLSDTLPPPGETAIPLSVERQASLIALEALGL